MGNPLSYRGWTMTWQGGRQLAGMTDGTHTLSFTYNEGGLRTAKTVGNTTRSYIWNSSQLLVDRGVDDTLCFHYNANGEMIGYTRKTASGETECFLVKNQQGDVEKVISADGTVLAAYTYDAWGNILTSTGSLANANPIRCRGYYFDNETGLYYLHSRYYDPNTGRFINADNAGMLGGDGDLQSYNLFAYCGNNPIMGFDPNGEWNWGGVAVGAGIVAATIITVATFGLATPLATVVAAAAISTGATMTFAAATDSVMVMDISCSIPVGHGYGKGGTSVIVDFGEDGGIFGYSHKGGGVGRSVGFSYSIGLVDNFEKPEDYSNHFYDINFNNTIGLDHCFDPTRNYRETTRATSVSFGIGKSFGIGYDNYSSPYILAKW